MQRCQSNKQLGLDRARTLVVVFPVMSLLVIKMAWNSKHTLESATRSLLENFEFFAYAVYECNTPLNVVLRV